MNKFYIMISVLLCSMAGMSGEKTHLLNVGQADLASHTTLNLNLQTKAANVSRDAVSMNWAVEGDVDVAVKPFQAESRGYYLEVDASQLYEGVSLPLTAPGALVRISPASQKGEEVSLDPNRLVLVNGQGRSFSEGSGMAALVTEEQVAAAQGNIFPPGTSAFRIHETVGAGEVLLFADDLAGVSERSYMVHVLEKNSATILKVQTENDAYLVGQTLMVKANLLTGGKAMSIERAEGRVISPLGESFPLAFDRNGYGSLELNGEVSNLAGLWQVRVAVDGAGVKRDASTAFALSLPTARFTGAAVVEKGKTGMAADLELEVATAGRFEVRGVLFGTDKSGELKAIAVSHSANWLAPGEHALRLSFDDAYIQASGLTAPYMVRDLRLIHQDRMSLIHRQADGLIIR